MNKYNLAFSSADSVPYCRYIVSLSDGTTVYENIVYGLETTWSRLKKYLLDTGLHITMIRVQAGDKIANIPVGQGYYIIHRESGLPGLTFVHKGIGVYRDGIVQILWYNHIGDCIEVENRPCEKNHPALILSAKTNPSDL